VRKDSFVRTGNEYHDRIACDLAQHVQQRESIFFAEAQIDHDGAELA
jgi:hypothetical protein